MKYKTVYNFYDYPIWVVYKSQDGINWHELGDTDQYYKAIDLVLKDTNFDYHVSFSGSICGINYITVGEKIEWHF